jgi:hypothetical protein
LLAGSYLTQSNQATSDGNGFLTLTFTPNFFLRCPKAICQRTTRRCTPVAYKVTGRNVICEPPSGSYFPRDTTRVKCTARQDRAVLVCYFDVTLIEDTRFGNS